MASTMEERVFCLVQEPLESGKKTEKISRAWDLRKLGQNGSQSAYNLFEGIHFHFSLIIMILFVILAGYLIIYNIFNIYCSENGYPGLQMMRKNGGQRGKQLKIAVCGREIIAIGIPIGLLCGYLAGLCMAPSLDCRCWGLVHRQEKQLRQ